MDYFILFLPAIIATIAFAISLTCYINKNGLIISVMPTMVLFLLIKDKIALISAVNMLIITFTLTYLVLTFVMMVKKRG